MPDTTPPTVLDITENESDNLIIAGNSYTYTITFDEDIDSATVSAADFSNSGTAQIQVGTITETTP